MLVLNDYLKLKRIITIINTIFCNIKLISYFFLARKSIDKFLLQDSFDHVGSPAVSKRCLFFAWVKLIEVIKWKASQDTLVFGDANGASDTITYYSSILKNLASLGARLKEEVATERRLKDTLSHEDEMLKRSKFVLIPRKCEYYTFIHRISEGLKVWGNDDKRLQWHKDVEDEYLKCKDDGGYICSPEFISRAAKNGPAEVALQTPYRAGVF